MRELILASRSPRRRQLLEMLGIPVQVRPADIHETTRPNETPTEYAERLAVEKAGAVPGEYVLGADTIVVLEGDVLEKPAD
ncbi:MAG: Maf family protein, partial [Gemmatimonadales bacterium]